MTRRWPFPGDRAVDRARQVAQQYRAALAQVDPAACRLLDWAATEAGETWIVPRPVRFSDDDFVSATDAADLIERPVRTVYSWISDGTLPSYPEGGKIRVRVADARRVDAARRANAQSGQ